MVRCRFTCLILATAILAELTGTLPRLALAENPLNEDASLTKSSVRELVWRDADHGAANVLYVMLATQGCTVGYDRYLTLGPGKGLPNSVTDLIAVAKRLGYPLAARRMSPKDLDGLVPPYIVHLDGDDLRIGTFLLVLNWRESDIVYLDGPSATIIRGGREKFLRRWSGVALVPVSRSRFPITEILCGLVAGFAGTLLLKRRRQ